MSSIVTPAKDGLFSCGNEGHSTWNAAFPIPGNWLFRTEPFTNLTCHQQHLTAINTFSGHFLLFFLSNQWTLVILLWPLILICAAFSAFWTSYSPMIHSTELTVKVFDGLLYSAPSTGTWESLTLKGLPPKSPLKDFWLYFPHLFLMTVWSQNGCAWTEPYLVATFWVMIQMNGVVLMEACFENSGYGLDHSWSWFFFIFLNSNIT